MAGAISSGIDNEKDRERMRLALRAAAEAHAVGEVPVGAVIFAEDELIGRAYNQRETLQDPTAHAEMLAITQAAAALGTWRLEGCCLYVTLEPCPMCAGAIAQARLRRLVYGAPDPRIGACGSVLNIFACERINHTVEVVAGILADECGILLRQFFAERR